MFPRFFSQVNTKIQRCKFHSGPNYFNILGIAENEADITKIKSAFRKKAKELHPDILRSKNISVQDAHAKFIALRIAYEVLINPLEREKYKGQLRRGNGEVDSNSPQNQYQTPHYAKVSNDFQKKYRKNTAITPFHLSSWGEFQKELDLALDIAFYGPSFQSTEECPFPEHMETEELKSVDDEVLNQNESTCILHIVHGRKFLGEILLLTKKPSQLSEDLCPDSEISKDVACLELKWGGQTLAIGYRFTVDNSQKIKLWHKESLDANKFESTLLVHRSDDSSFLKIAPDQYFINGEDTHFILRQYAPGVQSFMIYNKKFRYLEYKCTRAWLPSSMFWMFEPRDNKFDGGGWYIENNRDGQYTKYRGGASSKPIKNDNSNITEYEGGYAMHPAVCLLICAFSSLDRMRK